MKFSVITPSFNQLDWLRLCIASVRDQIVRPAERVAESRMALALGDQDPQFGAQGFSEGVGTLSIEHIVQDAGTNGVEEFAMEQGADFYRDGNLVFKGRESSKSEEGLQPGISDKWAVTRGARYSLKIYCERDTGMYDAVNKGLRKAAGDICSYLNCDEQYLPEALRWVSEFFAKSPTVDVVFGDVIAVSSTGEALCHRSATLPNSWHVMVAQLPIFTAATFFRAEMLSKGLFFPEGWRDLGDAVWSIELRRKKAHCRLAKRFLSTFTYTGENMNLQANARAEKARLTRSAPLAAKALAGPIVAFQRARKLLSGAYRALDLSYDIWCKDNPSCRKHFDVKAVGPFWPAYASPK